MNSCGFNQNEISLDANEIATIVFSSDNMEKDYLDSMLNSFKSLDLKTYFEMLLIVTTEGLKKFYGDSNNKVDISTLNADNIDLINSYLKKIKVQLNIDIVNQTEWNFNENARKTDFRKLIISTNTTLNDMYYVLERDAFVVISFTQL